MWHIRRSLLVLGCVITALTTSALASDEWWVLAKGIKCTPATLNGSDISPRAVMSTVDGCEITVYNQEAGILVLDCQKTELATIFVYGNSLAACMKAKEILAK